MAITKDSLRPEGRCRERSMHIDTLFRRLVANARDPELRLKVLALVGGKAIGLVLVLAAMRVYLAPALFAPVSGCELLGPDRYASRIGALRLRARRLHRRHRRARGPV